jgi:hypothetical protein
MPMEIMFINAELIFINQLETELQAAHTKLMMQCELPRFTVKI